MGENIIVFDIETKQTFDEVGGRDGLTKLGISVVGVYDYKTGKYGMFEESDLPKLAERLSEKPLLVGFNSRRFDVPILQTYISFDITKFLQLDIMEEIVKELNHRVSLDSVAQATLGIGKSGSGLDAIKYYREGRIDELKKYCMNDVKITREVYEYGSKNSELFYTSKFGGGKARVKVSWKIENPAEKGNMQQSLF